MARWGMRYGSCWAVQWSLDWFFSFGVHLNLKRRTTNDGIVYGPYLDLHLVCCVLSVGVNPIWAGTEHLRVSVARGGLHDDG